MIAMMRGCTVSTGIHVEKDWNTQRNFNHPDLNTKFKIEATRTFE